jgi:ribosome-associated protein
MRKVVPVPQAARERALTLLGMAAEKKAFAPALVRLDTLTSLTDYFVIISAGSARHVKAVAEYILEQAKAAKMPAQSVEGLTTGSWALLDFGDVIVHVFQPAIRTFYDLEGLWAEAPRERIPEDLKTAMESPPDEDDDYMD